MEAIACKLEGKEPDNSALFLNEYEAFVRSTAGQLLKKVQGLNIELEDLLQEGRMGLFLAAKRFDTNRGTGFLSYAGYFVRGAMLDWIRAECGRFEYKLMASIPGYRWVDDVYGMGELLCCPIDAGVDPYTQSPEQIYIRRELMHTVCMGLRACSARGQQYLLFRFGFADGVVHTTKEAARQYCIAWNTAVKLEKKALEFLKNNLIAHGERAG